MLALNKTVRINWPENELHGKIGHVFLYVGTKDEFWSVAVGGWSVMIAADKLVPVRPVTTWVDESPEQEPQGALREAPQLETCPPHNYLHGRCVKCFARH